MAFELCVFDFDGTLADTFGLFVEAVQTYAHRFGYKYVENEEAEELRLLTAREVIRHVGLAPLQIPLLAVAIRNYMARRADGIRLFPEMAVVLRRLKQLGVRTAVLSSNAARNVHQVLRRHQANGCDFCLCGIPLYGKRARLSALLRRARVAREKVLFIGDDVRDVGAAKACGVRSGAVTWGYNRGERLRTEQPDFLFQAPSDILGLFGPVV
ncbi:MAG: HAD hydrolase-like protein [Kiritimatiellae bacterium]|nr:HAD hydrolase-like protein [Kiritimatiellia bacterium]